jgi:hypothetical protein
MQDKKKKKESKVRDLKPKKDAKGGSAATDPRMAQVKTGPLGPARASDNLGRR